MDGYCCLTVFSRNNESREAFNKRLIDFWTFMLRNRESDYERVYAEATAFKPHGERLGREYLLEVEVADVLEAELKSAKLDHAPIDRDDLFSKYEASPPDWFQLEH